jgi:hypothetical protein
VGVCSFQFLLGIVSAAFLKSWSHGTHEHISLSLFLRPAPPNLMGQIPVFISPRNSVTQLNRQALGFPTCKSKSELYYDGQSVGQSILVSSTHCGAATNFFPLLLNFFRQLRVCWCGAPSLTRSQVCTFQFLPGINSAAFLRSESHGTHEHSLLSLFLRLLNLEGQVPVFISLRNRVAQLYPRALGLPNL